LTLIGPTELQFFAIKTNDAVASLTLTLDHSKL